MFELIINILLFIFLGFTFFTHVLEAAVPASVARNPYALQPDVWPKTIIILLEICLIVNIIKIIKKNKGNPDFTLGAFVGSIPGFLKSKLFLGIVIMVAASFILETVGFIVTALFVLFFYGLLLGEKNVVRLLIASVCITLVLYPVKHVTATIANTKYFTTCSFFTTAAFMVIGFFFSFLQINT